MHSLFKANGHLCANFWKDFHETIFAIPETKLEIAFAKKGGSAFNQAIYFENISIEKLKTYATYACNVAFLSGCSRKYLLSPLGEKTKRMAGNQCIRHKNILVFDMDFKDNIPGYQSLNIEQQQKEAAEFIEVVSSKLNETKLPIWMLNFSGHGLHFYLKLAQPIPINSSFKGIYSGLVSYIEASLGVCLDTACSNPARLIRVPGSTNWKDVSQPIECCLLKHEPNVFADELVSQFQKSIDVPRSKVFKDREKILRHLNLIKVLEFFKFEKTASIYEVE